MTLAKKKAIVLIVEGPTDQMILEPLERLIDNHRFKIKVIGGDSYTDILNQKIPPKNIVGKIMKSVMEETKFTQKDIALVMQLVDTDGAFFSEDSFIVDSTAEPIEGKTYSYSFSENAVKLQNMQAKQSLYKRWKQKGDILKALCKGIKYSQSKIPYYLYFNSINLEHVTSNQILSDNDKDDAALRFVESINGDINKLIDFFASKCPYESYAQSWSDIVSDKNWHNSKSNIHFLIKEIIRTEEDSPIT